MLASVVVPVFNHRRFVADALWSVHAQTWPDLELIVVDDGSTDGSPDVVAALARDPAFAGRFRRFHFVANTANQGAAATIEQGLALAQGEVLAILNSDDLYRPERLARLIAALDDGHRLAFGGIACIDGDGRPDLSPVAVRLAGLPRSVRDYPTVSTAFLGINRAVSTGNLVFTRGLHRRVGGFRALALCHDWDFALAATLVTEPVLVDEPLYEYRLHGDNSFRSLGRQAQSEGEAVVGRFVEAVRCGRVANPVLAAVVTAPGVLDRLLETAGDGVADIARAIDAGRPARPPRQVPIADEASPLDELVATDAGPARPTLLVVLAECDRSGAALLALNLGGHLRRTHDPVLLALAGGPLLETLQVAFGRVVVADAQRIGEPGRLAGLANDLLDRIGAMAAICIGRQPSELHACFEARLLPTVLVAVDARDLTMADRCTAVLASGVPVPPGPLARAQPLGPSDFSMARSRKAIVEELERLRAIVAPADAPPGTAIVMGFGPLDPAAAGRGFQDCARLFQARPIGRPVRFVWIATGHADDAFDPAQWPDVLVLPEARSNEAALRLADLVLATAPRDVPLVALDAMARAVPVIALADAAAASCLAATPEAVVPDADALAGLAARILQAGARCHPLAARQQAAVAAGPTMAAHAAAVAALADAAVAAAEQARLDIATLIHDDLFEPDLQAPDSMPPEARAVAARRHVQARSRAAPRRPFPGFHPDLYRAAAMAGAADANPGAHFVRAGRPDGPWQRAVIRPSLRVRPPPAGLRVAIHLHIHYPDLARDLLGRLPPAGCPPLDLLVTTDSAAKADAIAATAAGLGVAHCEVRVTTNRGRDLGPFLAAWGTDGPVGYDVVGHFHAKRSPHLAARDGEAWRTFLLENLLGGFAPMAGEILHQFAADPRLGLVHADDPHVFGWNWHDPGSPAATLRSEPEGACFGTETNRAIAERLAPRLGLGALPDHVDFPAGSMFWARPQALAPLFALGLGPDDYPPEPLPQDGTILHALERLLPIVAQSRGYRTAVTHIPGIRR